MSRRGAGRRWPRPGLGLSPAVTAWAALLVVYVVWGSTFFGIRVAVRHFPPATLAGARFVVAGLLLFPFALRSGGAALRTTDRIGVRQWLSAAVLGVLLPGLGNGGVTIAEQHVESGTAALLAATIPLWMIVLSAVFDRRSPGARPVLAVLVGLGGVELISGTPGGSASGGMIALCLCSAAGWALGSVLADHLALPARSALSAAMQLLIGGAALLAVGAARGEWAHPDLGRVPVTGWLAMAWLILAGSILAYTAYGYALAHLPIGVVSTYAFVNPVVAVVLGALFLGERLRGPELGGAAFIVLAVILTLRARSRRPAPRSTSAGPAADPTRTSAGGQEVARAACDPA